MPDDVASIVTALVASLYLGNSMIPLASQRLWVRQAGGRNSVRSHPPIIAEAAVIEYNVLVRCLALSQYEQE